MYPGQRAQQGTLPRPGAPNGPNKEMGQPDYSGYPGPGGYPAGGYPPAGYGGGGYPPGNGGGYPGPPGGGYPGGGYPGGNGHPPGSAHGGNGNGPPPAASGHGFPPSNGFPSGGNDIGNGGRMPSMGALSLSNSPFNSNPSNQHNSGPNSGSSSSNGHSSSAPVLDDKFVDLEAIKLAQTREEKKMFEDLAELYSIIMALEYLEKAYVRDAIKPEEYGPQCKKLIAQYRTQNDALGQHAIGIFDFMNKYTMNCFAAANRLKIGVPATIEHGDGKGADSGQQLYVFHCVQHFITIMDSLKLDMKAVDELHPNMTELMDAINKVVDLPPDHVSKLRVKSWLVRLNEMKAHDELSPEDVRQMSMDLELAYSAFHKFIESRK